MLAHVSQDLRYAARMLRRNPGFLAVAILSLALGIGVNTSIFTLFYSLALRPLPLKDADRIVNVYQTFDGPATRRVQGNIALLSYPEYLSYRDRAQVFSGLVAYADVALTMSGGEAEKVNGLLVSDNYFSTLGAAPELGRTFAAGECQVAGRCPMVVLSDGFWQRRFGSDSTLVGKTITLNRQRFVVVGIGAPDFRGTQMTAPDVWLPLTMQASVMPGGDFLQLQDFSWLNVVGRMKAGVSSQQATAEMRTLAAASDREYLSRSAEPGVRKTNISLVPGAYLNFPEVRSRGLPIVALVGVAVGLILLIACANVSNLLLARAATRRKEVVMRMALGASRVRLVQQLLTESMLLAVVGGGAGLLLAFWLPPVLLSVIPETGVDVNLAPNATVLSFTLVISLVTGIVFGLAPALEASKVSLTAALNSAGRTVSSRTFLRGLLVVTQVAVSLVLLIGAALLTRSLQQAQSADLGFNPKDVLVLSMDPASAGYDGKTTGVFNRQLEERLTALPGVKSVTYASAVPLAATMHSSIEIEGRPAHSSPSSIPVSVNIVSPTYFQTLGISIVRGRGFRADERQGAQRTAIVSQGMAQRYWPNEDAVGKRFKDETSSYEIVGVAKDVSSSLGQANGPFFYVAAQPDEPVSYTFMLRTDGNAPAVANSVKQVTHTLDKNVPVSIARLEDNLDRKLRPARAGALFSGALSLLALALAAAGIYGVTAYFVSERTREIGIRMALGAKSMNVMALISGQGLLLVAGGIVIGLAVSFALTRIMKSLLFGVAVTDPLTFVAVPLFLMVVGLLACYAPTRRAMKIEPHTAMRND